MIKGFKEFILRGNVIDLAVAVVIGAAFTLIVNSIVAGIGLARLLREEVGCRLLGVDVVFIGWRLVVIFDIIEVRGEGLPRVDGFVAGGSRHQVRSIT